MPLVYREGHEAFTMLLGEIIYKYPDHSFFASQLRYVDFIPRSPLEFCDSQSVVASRSPQLQRHYMPAYHSYPFHLMNTGLQITLPIVTTLVPQFVFGVLDCWDFETASTQATRSISRIWIQLLQKGPQGLQQYSRLLWPQTFFPVKLVRKLIESRVPVNLLAPWLPHTDQRDGPGLSKAVTKTNEERGSGKIAPIFK